MHNSEPSHLKVYDEQAALPSELPALPALFNQARMGNLRVLAVACSADAGPLRAVAKRRHDLSAALRTLGFTVKALQTGYTFQDDIAAAKIEAIAKAVQILEREAVFLSRLLLGDGHT